MFSKTEAGSQIQKTNSWLPVGTGREEGQPGMGEGKVQTTVYKKGKQEKIEKLNTPVTNKEIQILI